MINEELIEEYTENIDISDMIIQYYKKRKTPDLEKYFLKIEEWLQRDVAVSYLLIIDLMYKPGDNKPLVIKSDLGVDNKTLLIKWICYHQENSKGKFKDFIVPHFAGTGGKSSNYFYAMYKILVGLREHFNISQKVELLEDKILMYFNYWLEICNKTIYERVVDDSQVILVFDGIDLFREAGNTEETNVALWLSQAFPSRIKVIVTASPQSESMKQLNKSGCKVLNVANEFVSTDSFINTHLSSRVASVDQAHKERVISILDNMPDSALREPSFIKTYLSTLIPCPSEDVVSEKDINKEEFRAIFRKMNYNNLEKVSSLEELIHFVLDYYSQNIVEYNNFRDILVALTICDKGLSSAEIIALTKISQKEWKYIVAIFETFMMKYKDLWKINDETLIKAVHQKFIQNNAEYIAKLHSEIADVLATVSNSLRKLEEETHHLFQCKAYFRLKEAVTNIENFLLLFNPRNKYELCRYWQVLEHNGFDPAQEYTNAIEGFDLRYHPTPEQTFMIILQISRFLLEFGDFETLSIPDYRHPPIIGGQDLKEIGLKREIQKLGMFVTDEFENGAEKEEGIEELEHQLTREFPELPKWMIQDIASQIFNASQKNKNVKTNPLQDPVTGELPAIVKTEEHEEIKPEDSIMTQPKPRPTRGLKGIIARGSANEAEEKFNNRKDLPILSTIEALNVDIPKHREEFKLFYVQQGQKIKQPIQPRSFDDIDDVTEEEEQFTALATHLGGQAAGKTVQPTTRRSVQAIPSGRPSVDTTLPLSEKSKLETKNNELLSTSDKLTLPKTAENQPTFYYYKRWLWMMYPWVCLSYKNNYSRIIFECFSSPTKYVSVSDERERTMQALRLAIESKIKKELIYAKPGDLTQHALLKNLKKGVLALPYAKKSIRGLPPIEKDVTASNLLLKTKEIKEKIPPNSESKKSLKLGDLSPVKSRESTRQLPQSTKSIRKKGNHLLVTGDFTLRDKATNASFSANKENLKRASNVKPVSLGNLDEPVNTTSFNKTKTFNTLPEQEMTIVFGDQRVQNMIRNARDAIEYMIRPTFMDSVFKVTPKQIEMFETKVIQLKKDMDELTHMNKAAHDKLKHLMSLEDGLNARGANDATERASVRLKRLEQEIVNAEKMQNEAMEQGKRLSLIINVCKKNKTQNELWIHNLNYLVNNFKKVISYEEKNADRLQRETFVLQQTENKIIEEYGKKMELHQKNMQGVKKEANKRKEIIQQIHDTQAKLQRMISDSSEESNHSSEEARFTINKDKIANMKKYTQEEMLEMREQVEKIRSTIGLDFETPKFKEFINGLDKMTEYEQAIYETESDIEKLKEELSVHSNFLVTYRKARFADRRAPTLIKSAYDDIKDEDRLQALLRERKRQIEDSTRSINKNTKLVLDAKNTLVKICTTIGLQIDDKTLLFAQLPAEEIATRLEERLSSVRNSIPQEEYERFRKGDVNFERYYREQGYDFEINKNHIFNNPENEREMGLYKRGNIIMEPLQHDMA